MALTRALKPVRLIAGSAIFVLVLILTIKSFQEFRRSQERGNLIASIVREHYSSLKDQVTPDDSIYSQKGWPDDFLGLQTWLIFRLAQSSSPASVADELASLAQRHAHSPVMQTALNRWQSSLNQWSGMDHLFASMEGSALLEEGRLKHSEATGYRKIGRQYDAVAHYLWSAAFLHRFIEQNPDDAGIPEALYLLGDVFLRVRHALPAQFRGDRILNLCSELYPDSIWAGQAYALWRSEIGNGI